jgi:hypothetical protein
MNVEWFQGWTVEDQEEGKTIMPLPLWAAFLAVFIVLIQGCATTKEETADVRVCAFQLIGKTQSDLPVVKMQCITEEAYAEANK